MPRGFCNLPDDVHVFIDCYFHRQEVDDSQHAEEEGMSTDTEAAEAVNRLRLQCPEATNTLDRVVHKVLAPAMATRPEDEEEEDEDEYRYDSDDSVVDLNEQYPEVATRNRTIQSTDTSVPWRPDNFGSQERATLNRAPDLCEAIDQMRAAKVVNQVPVQSVAPIQLPFASVQDLDCQRHRRNEQTVAKCLPSPLEPEQRKRSKMPPQPDPYGTDEEPRQEQAGRERGCSRVWGMSAEHCQMELDAVRARSKSRA